MSPASGTRDGDHPPCTERGLTSAQADELLRRWGPNELARVRPPSAIRAIARQFLHPLALLLWAAAGLSLLSDSVALAPVIVLVLVVNAVFAYVQELQAEHAVEAIRDYLPEEVRVVRDGRGRTVPAAEVVPGDVMFVVEGARICADATLLEGVLEVDAAALTGESEPVLRRPVGSERVLHSGTLCVRGDGTAVVTATGMRTELGRIAALSQRVRGEPSPLEAQVRRAAVLIAVVSLLIGAAFVPLGIFAGLPGDEALIFAIGLLVANVPEGLLPTITLALAVSVRALARRRALVKRLSAVETLGSTDVICTDKTGTLTENRLVATWIWTPERGREVPGDELSERGVELLHAAASCSDAEIDTEGEHGDPTELALVKAAAQAGHPVSARRRTARRRQRFGFDPERRLMTVVVATDAAGGVEAHTKGAPEAVLDRCDPGVRSAAGDRTAAEAQVRYGAGAGLRMLAIARRPLDDVPARDARDDVERDLHLLGLVALEDRLREEVPAAVAACQQAGIRIFVITGDHALTGRAVAQRAGIADLGTPVLTGGEVDAMSDEALVARVAGTHPMVFARSSPECKLRIARCLQEHGHVVAMTGDGVNDAPALRQADIGIAMGRSGTDVARAASAMVLTDDNFATIATAVREGRRVYENLRKFIVYVFAHTTPEAIPFLIFALSGGTVPLPLTAAQVLAIDLGTETLPALALGREPAEPDVMERPPRPRSQSLITGGMLLRAYGFLGLISAALVTSGFFAVLVGGGWRPGDATGPGAPLRETYVEATTITFLGIVACQVGTAFASRTDRSSLRAVGFFTNRLLFWGIAFELVIAGLITYVPVLQLLFNTTAVSAQQLLVIAPFPIVVWGADELRRWVVRTRAGRSI